MSHLILLSFQYRVRSLIQYLIIISRQKCVAELIFEMTKETKNQRFIQKSVHAKYPSIFAKIVQNMILIPKIVQNVILISLFDIRLDDRIHFGIVHIAIEEKIVCEEKGTSHFTISNDQMT